MPITYGMVAGFNHGCDRQPLTSAQEAEKSTWRRMHRYACVNIDELLGLEEEREANKKRKAAYMESKKCRA